MEEQKQKNEIPNVDNYVDVEGISTKKLNLGLWYVEHVKQFKLVITVFLGIVAGTSWLYTIYGFGNYVIRGMKEDDILARDLAVSGHINHNYFAQTAPADLQVGPVNVLRSDAKSDLAAQISNSNQRHWGEFEYFFVADGKETGRESGFILPGEIKYLMALSRESVSQNVQLRIEKMKWHRVTARDIRDWNDFRDNHLDIVVSNTQFTPQSNESLNQLSFKVSNNTAFNYWNVKFLIVFTGSQGNIAGVNKYGLGELMSGDKRDINIAWSGNLPPASQIMIVPEINIMKDSSYIKFEGGVGEEK